MRALRVVGVTGDGSVVLEDPGRRERYTVPADEQLRAAARGDVTRLGQIAIELESQLRPREIQARIRGGASVDEVAAAAGVPTQKIERFAYPVLLERSRTAELAQSAHPQRADGPDSRTLGETVAHTFGLRGQDYAGAGWDSWKGEDGKWVVVLTWQTGRSDNAAHWAFQPGAHGGTVVALDEHASDLVEGLPARPLRPLGSVVDMARDEDHAPEAPTTAAPARAVAAAGGQQPEAWAGRGIAPEQRRASPPPPRTRVETPGRTVGTRPDDTRAPAAAAPVVPKRVEQVEGTDAINSTDATDGTGSAGATDTASSGPASDGVSADGTTPGGTTSGGASSTGSDGVDPVVPAPAATATDAIGTGSSATGPAHDATDATASAAATSTGAATSASDTDAAGSPVPAGTSPAATASATPEDTTAEAATSTAGSSAAAPSTAAQSTEAQSAEARSTEAHSAERPAGTDTDSAAASPATDDRRTATNDGAATNDGSADERTEAPAAATTETPATSEQETDPTPAQDAETAAPRRPSTAGSRRTKKGKPVMPSWDEVLLGVRGQR